MIHNPELEKCLAPKKYTGEQPNNFILLFDIDYCLYSGERCKEAEDNFMNSVENNLIKEWNENENRAKAKTIKELKSEYGSIVEGITKFYGKDLKFCRQNSFYDIHKYIEKNEDLIKALEGLPYDKYCFTNGLQRRSEPILEKLEIQKFFKAVFCPDDDDSQESSQRIAKPKVEAFRFVENCLKVDKGTRLVLFDDLKHNIEMAKSEEFQWIAYLVDSEKDIVTQINEFKRAYLPERETLNNTV